MSPRALLLCLTLAAPAFADDPPASPPPSDQSNTLGDKMVGGINSFFHYIMTPPGQPAPKPPVQQNPSAAPPPLPTAPPPDQPAPPPPPQAAPPPPPRADDSAADAARPAAGRPRYTGTAASAGPGLIGVQAAPAPTGAADAAAPPRAQKALKKALRLGDQLKKGPEDDLDNPPAAGAPASAPAGHGSGDPANPATLDDLRLAYAGGMRAVFDAMGFSVAPGGGTVLKDGRPATATELAGLKAAIAGAPTALLRRPDFFTVLPPARFSALKAEYPAAAQKPPFKDVALSADGRDFVRSASCSKVSGDCSAYASESSYEKGAPVPPEDLAAIDKALGAEAPAAPAAPPPASPERDRRAEEVARAAFAALARPGGDLDSAAELNAALNSPADGRGERLRRALTRADAALSAKEAARDPVLGLYLVARADYRLFLLDQLSSGALAAGTSLEPWELSLARGVPPGTRVETAAEPAASGAAYRGLRMTLPDGSTRFEGARAVDAGVERLAQTRGPGGETIRQTTLTPAGAAAPARVETVALDAQGNAARRELVSGGGTRVEIQENFNLSGPWKGQPSRVEVDVAKAGSVQKTILDEDNRTSAVVEPDGSFTVEAIDKDKGLPLDPKDPSSRWRRQKGLIVDGVLKLSEIELADCPAAPSGHCTLLRGSSDASGNFSPEARIGADGAGVRRKGALTLSVRDTNGVESVGGGELDLSSLAFMDAVKRLPAAKAFADQVVAAGRWRPEDAVALANWMADFYEDASAIERDPQSAGLIPADGTSPSAFSIPPNYVLRFSTADASLAIAAIGQEFDLGDPANQTGAGVVPKEVVSMLETGRITSGTAFKDGSPRALVVPRPTIAGFSWQGGGEGLYPWREYLTTGRLHQWVDIPEVTHAGDAGFFSSGGTWNHVFLTEMTRQSDGRWASPCDDRDASSKCGAREQIGKPQQLSHEASFAEALPSLPGVKQLAALGKHAFYYAVATKQQFPSLQLPGLRASRDQDTQLAIIANRARSGASSTALKMLDAKPDLKDVVDLMVVDARARSLGNRCEQMGSSACAAFAKTLGCKDASQKPPCVTPEERLGVLEDAYSPSDALKYASEGGPAALYVLGGLGLAGEQSAEALPLMGVMKILGGVGGTARLGALARAASLTDRAAGLYMTATWAPAIVDNATRLASAAHGGDLGQAIASGVQGVMDAVFLRSMFKAGPAAPRQTDQARQALAAERTRLEAARDGAPTQRLVFVEVPDSARAAFDAILKANGHDETVALRDGRAILAVAPGADGAAGLLAALKAGGIKTFERWPPGWLPESGQAAAAPPAQAKTSWEIVDQAQPQTPADVQRRMLAAAERESAQRLPPGSLVGGMSSDAAVPTQSEGDCSMRATANNPAARPVLAALGGDYAKLVAIAENYTGKDIRKAGLNYSDLRDLYHGFGLELGSLAAPAGADELGSAILKNGGGVYGEITIQLPGGKEFSHAVVVTGFFNEAGQRRFVVTDSNYDAPRLYSWEDLQALQLQTAGVGRLADAGGQPLGDAQLAQRAAQMYNDFGDFTNKTPRTFNERLGPGESRTLSAAGLSGSLKLRTSGGGVEVYKTGEQWFYKAEGEAHAAPLPPDGTVALSGTVRIEVDRVRGASGDLKGEYIQVQDRGGAGTALDYERTAGTPAPGKSLVVEADGGTPPPAADPDALLSQGSLLEALSAYNERRTNLILHGNLTGPGEAALPVEARKSAAAALKTGVGDALRQLLQRGIARFAAGSDSDAIGDYAAYLENLSMLTHWSTNDSQTGYVFEAPEHAAGFAQANANLEAAVRRKLGAAPGETLLFHGTKDVQGVLAKGLRGCAPPRCNQGGAGLYMTTKAAYALIYAGIGFNAEAGARPALLILRAKELPIVDVDSDAAEAEARQRAAKTAKNGRPSEEETQLELTKVIDERYGKPAAIRLKGSIGERLGYDEIVIRDPARLAGLAAYYPLTLEARKGSAAVSPDAKTFPKAFLKP